MSVFSSHPPQNYGRSLGAFLAVVGVAVGSIYFGNVIRAPLTAAVINAGFQSGVNLPNSQFSEAQETIFPEPARFDEEGTIVSILASGQGVAVRLSGDRGYIQAYAQSGQIVPISEGFVRIQGALTEISCAYANTLFEGRCTPTVLIDSIELVAIRPL